MATNICVWIRTLVLESLKEVTAHYIARGNEPEKSPIAEDLRQYTLIHAGMTMGTELRPGEKLLAFIMFKANKLFSFRLTRC